MTAIFKREMRAYFTSSTGYVFLAVSLAISGLALSATTLLSGSSDLTVYYSVIIFLLVLFLPILTMKTFSEEKKTKTEQLLLTAPVSIPSMVMGKFLSCFVMFSISTLVSCINFIPVIRYSATDVLRESGTSASVVFGNIIALLLVGMCFIAIGIFVSSLTDNQFAAAIMTIVILLALLMISLLNSFISSSAIRNILNWLSVFTRFQYFTHGIFDFGALIYYLSVAGVFLFLTCRVFESRRVK